MVFRLENVTYKDILHIDDLTITNGKVTCIVGKSGSGKTTLTKLLNGLISPDKGGIYFKNQSLIEWDLVELRREVTMLQQTPSIYEGTIRDNLQIGRHFAGGTEATRGEMEKALKVVHLDKDLAEDTADLSGGEKQRLALARVLLLDPHVLILDEPTSALDEDTAFNILENVLKVSKEKGQTIIMITHDGKLVQTFSDEVIEMMDGNAKKKEVHEWNKV